jgi:hypothetical protein
MQGGSEGSTSEFNGFDLRPILKPDAAGLCLDVNRLNRHLIVAVAESACQKAVPKESCYSSVMSFGNVTYNRRSA